MAIDVLPADDDKLHHIGGFLHLAVIDIQGSQVLVRLAILHIESKGTLAILARNNCGLFCMKSKLRAGFFYRGTSAPCAMTG